MTVSKFHVGDYVISTYYGKGVVERIIESAANEPQTTYPVAVRWGSNAKEPNTINYYTKSGKSSTDKCNFDTSKFDIHPTGFNIFQLNDDDECELYKGDHGIVDQMTEDAINPSHYKVKGIPEAIDLMKHMMTKEQFEGFLWGNIIKYSYRYGRKGDKAETAGKLKWYAKRLEEVLKGEHNET